MKEYQKIIDEKIRELEELSELTEEQSEELSLFKTMLSLFKNLEERIEPIQIVEFASVDRKTYQKGIFKLLDGMNDALRREFMSDLKKIYSIIIRRCQIMRSKLGKNYYT